MLFGVFSQLAAARNMGVRQLGLAGPIVQWSDLRTIGFGKATTKRASFLRKQDSSLKDAVTLFKRYEDGGDIPDLKALAG